MSFMLLLIEYCGVATAEIVKNLRKILQVHIPAQLCTRPSHQFYHSVNECTLLGPGFLQCASTAGFLQSLTIVTRPVTLQVSCSFLLFPKAVSWMHALGGMLVVGGMCLFMQRPAQQDVQKVRQSPKVIDMSSEAVSFHESKPIDFQIRASHSSSRKGSPSTSSDR